MKQKILSLIESLYTDDMELKFDLVWRVSIIEDESKLKEMYEKLYSLSDEWKSLYQNKLGKLSTWALFGLSQKIKNLHSMKIDQIHQKDIETTDMELEEKLNNL